MCVPITLNSPSPPCRLQQGGAEVAKYCSAHICDVVKATDAFKEGNLGLGLKQTFLKMDDLLRTPAGQVCVCVSVRERERERAEIR